MSHNFDLDKAVNYLKVILQEVRCFICDKADGTRMRYWCGHAACGDCAEAARSCVLCLTPPRTENAGPVLDPVLTARVKHASQLLQSFEDTFGIDVMRRQRISEQLKIEKEIFPDCIQAPQTYGKKHKTSDNSLYCGDTSKKRKRTILPGELVDSSFVPKMDNTKNNVEDWLDQHESDLFQYQPRRPFSDLGINSPVYQQSPIKKRADITPEKAREGSRNKTITKSRKRLKKTTATTVKSDITMGNFLTTPAKGYTSGWKSVERAKMDFDNYDKRKLNYSVTKQKNEKEEVINDTVVIEDSQTPIVEIRDSGQSEVIDKDRQAWLAVLAADNIRASSVRRSCDQDDLHNPIDTPIEGKQLNTANHSPSILVASAPDGKCYSSDSINPATKRKVPFFKKSKLRTCNANKSTKPISTQAQDVSVTVEIGSLMTTIKLSRVETRSINKTSKSVQTDEYEENGTKHPNKKLDKGVASKCPLKIDSKMNECSEDLFSGKKQSTFKPEPENVVEMDKPVPICESGSESENEPSLSLIVTADVHKSMDAVERKVLTDLHDKISKKPTSSKRGHTPESSNSSDKENRDPNKMKKGRIIKKNNNKKIKITSGNNLL